MLIDSCYHEDDGQQVTTEPLLSKCLYLECHLPAAQNVAGIRKTYPLKPEPLTVWLGAATGNLSTDVHHE